MPKDAELDELDQQLKDMEDSEQETLEEDQPETVEGAEGEDDGEEEQEREGAEAEQEEEAEQPHSVPLNVALEWKRERGELRRELGTLQQQIRELSGAVKPPAAEEEQAPDFEANPVEYLAFQQRRQTALIENLQTALQTSTQRSHQQQVQSEVNAVEQVFANKTPDYWEATSYLRERRLGELQTMFGFSEEEAQQRFAEETARFINTATARGESFAENAYKMARQLGFKGGAQPAAAEAKASKAEEGNESLREIARKQKQARTLGSSTGKAPKDDLSPDDIDDMSDEEFDKLFTGDAGDRRLKKLFG